MNKLRIHYLQHVPFEGTGYIGIWAKANNHIITATQFYNNDPLPGVEDFDWLIIMGGPMSVADEGKYPWLKIEKEFIKQIIQKEKIVIGICLGAQLIAEALGAKVYPNPQKEIGWFPVSLTTQNHQLTNKLPNRFKVLHWHGDTFDLPDSAMLLMQTTICKHQAFIYDDRVLGLQFHLETTPETLTEMIENCRHELKTGRFIQTEEVILTQKALCKQANIHLIKLLNYFANK